MSRAQRGGAARGDESDEEAVVVAIDRRSLAERVTAVETKVDAVVERSLPAAVDRILAAIGELKADLKKVHQRQDEVDRRHERENGIAEGGKQERERRAAAWQEMTVKAGLASAGIVILTSVLTICGIALGFIRLEQLPF